jgi:hypothetical protein
MASNLSLSGITGTAKDGLIVGGVALAAFAIWKVWNSSAVQSTIDGYKAAEPTIKFVGDAANVKNKLVWDGAKYVYESAWGGTDGGFMGAWSNWWEQVFSGNYESTKSLESSSAYVVIRQRDFNSQWQMSSSAYQAAKGLHSDNEKILKTYVLDGLKLKPSLQKIVKLTDFVVIRPNGEIQSA